MIHTLGDLRFENTVTPALASGKKWRTWLAENVREESSS